MSPDAFEYHLKRGYVTIDGGHRIGFCGNTIIKNNEVATINCINTVVIRVCKNKVLYDNCVFEDLFTEKCPSNICIISPPGCGKTTFLRNFIFYISNKLNWLNICVVDERCEIINSNINYNNVSIVYGMPKKFATETVIKCMSPDLIVYDEIYSNEEFECIKKANSSGVFCAFSLHGKSIENLINNGINIKSLCNSQVIAVELSKNRGCGTIESIRRI